MHMRFALGWFAFLFAAGSAWAQIGAPVQAGGVEVDGEGVVKSRTTKPDARLAELWKNAAHLKKEGHLLYISLPRILDEARRAQADGKPVADNVRYLGGMVKLQYVFVYPDQNDIVIAGPAEPFDPDPYRPLGKITGRPVLQLDDVVTALRNSGPGRSGPVGCDLQITQEIADRIRKKTQEVGAKIEQLGAKKAAELIADAGGLQPVKFFGVEPATRFAVVCIEADYQLKQLGLGILESPVKKVKSYNSLARAPEPAHRFVLESNYDSLLASPDGCAFELRGSSLKVATGLMGVPKDQEGNVSDPARTFAKLCSENIEDLQKHLVSWADVANLADLSVLAALIAHDDLHTKAKWDLASALGGYKGQAWVAPKSAKTLTVYRNVGQQTIFVSGGVVVDAAAAVKNRAADEKETLKAKSQRPVETWSGSRK
jgi:hypothetical protein